MSLVGHGSVREAVLGRADRAPSAPELARMQELVRPAMRGGAFGLCTGLFYVPGSFARAEEVIALAHVAGEFGGIHISHMRDEAGKILESVRETIAIGEEGHLPTQITHHKMIGRAAWGRSVESLRLVQEARDRGVDVTIDQYPYTASSTALRPRCCRRGRSRAARRRSASGSRTPGARAHPRGREGQDPQRARGRRPAQHRDRGLRLRPRARGPDARRHPARPRLPADVENAAELALEIVERGGASAIFHAISEEDVERILVSPYTMIASDGEIPVFGQGAPHPRSYGTFARVLGVYVREKGLLTLEEAIRKMTSLPAARLGLGDRGLCARA